MKRMIFVMFAFIYVHAFVAAQAVGVGTITPHASAQLDVSSATKGMLPPRMNTMQRNAISNPAAGIVIFNTSTQNLEIFNGINWNPLVDANNYTNSLVKRKLWGGSAYDVIYAMDKSADGGLIMVGLSFSSNTGTLSEITGTGGSDIWVIKTDVSGNIEWQKLLGGTGDDEAYSISATTDGGYILAGNSTNAAGGIFSGSPGLGNKDGLLVKLSSTGTVEWYKLLGGTLDDNLYTVQQSTDGGYIVSGTSASSNSGTLTGVTGNGIDDGWIIKLDGNGNQLWQQLLGGTAVDRLSAIQQTNDGGFIAAGHSGSSNTGTLTGVNGNGSLDIWIIKIDQTGNIIWQKLLGGSGTESVSLSANKNSIQKTLDGGYIIAGYSGSTNSGTLSGVFTNGVEDCLIIKLDANGIIQWQKLIGGNQSDHGVIINQTSDGGYLAFAETTSSNTGTLSNYITNGSTDIWAIKLSNTGTIQWQKLMGGANLDTPNSFLQTATGFIVIGNCSNNSFGTGYLSGLTGNGVSDAWFFKLDQYGNTY